LISLTLQKISHFWIENLLVPKIHWWMGISVFATAGFFFDKTSNWCLPMKYSGATA